MRRGNPETDALSETAPETPATSDTLPSDVGRAAGLAAGPPEVPGYVVGAKLGSGGFGEVFRARHAVIDREVAIKILHAKYGDDAAAMARFMAEARAVNRVSHPGIVEVFDFGVLADGRQYCVMELLRGTTLRELLRERGHLPLGDAMPILRGIADAVDAAHAAGIAHRDLKPDNVFVLDGGSVKLIDFGLAKLTRDAATPALTATGAVFGTPLYMSPEQCRGNAVSTATDAYSFGILTYHVLVGELPFDGDALELALHHLNDDPPLPSQRLSELDARVDRVVLALMAKDPAQRPARLRAAVDALVGESALPARVTRRRWKRFALPAIAIGGAAAAAIAALVVRAGNDPHRQCALADAKLANVWTTEISRELKTRFDAVTRADIPGTWTRVSTDLDTYRDRWRERWDAMCEDTGSRQRDPLLWAQREACLEGVLTTMAGVVKTLRAADVRQFSLGVTNDFVHQVGPIDFCTNEKQLRSQKPPVPLAIRDRVLALQDQFGVARSEFREGVNGGKPEKIDGAIARMKAIEDQLVALGQSGLGEADWRAGYLVRVAERDPARIPEVRAAIQESIRRAESAFDDAALANLYGHLFWLEMEFANSPRVVVEGILEKQRTALQRAGKDERSIAVARAQLAARDGHLDEAVEIMRSDKAILDDEGAGMRSAGMTADWLVKLRRLDDAIALRRHIVEVMSDRLGASHHQVAGHHMWLAEAYTSAARYNEAEATLDRVQAIHEQLGADVAPSKRSELANLRIEIAAHTGRLVHATIEEWIFVAERAFERGDVGLFVRTVEKLPTDPAHAGVVEELRSLAAFYRGDAAALEAHARRSLAAWNAPGEFRIANGWVTVAEALRRKDTTAQLLALAHRDQDVAALGFFVGIAGRMLGRPAEAVRSFEVQLAIPRRDVHLAEAAAWAGTAKLEAGDATGALPLLEDSLAILANCCGGSHYFTPLAKASLARTLVATSGDRARAAQLAKEARDGFTKLGGFWRGEIAKLLVL